MEPADKKRMAAKILGEYEPAHLEMLDFIDKFPDLPETPAQFQERYAQVALKCFWREMQQEAASQDEGYFGGAAAGLESQLTGERGASPP